MVESFMKRRIYRLYADFFTSDMKDCNMKNEDLKALGIVKKAGRKGTRFLLKSKDLSGKERYVTIHITDTSTRKEIAAEIEKARIKLKNDTSSIKKFITAWHEAQGHTPHTRCSYASALKGLSLDIEKDRLLCVDIAADVSIKASSRAVKITIIRSFFRWLIAVGIAHEDPTAGIRVKKSATPRSRVLTDGEIQKIMKSCDSDPDARLALMIMLATGCRKSTAALVTPKSLRKGLLSLYNAKCGRPYAYAIPIEDPALIRAIERGYEGDPAKAIRRLARIMRDLGPDGSGEYATPHTIRHTWATRALRSGVPIDTISRVLDHSSISITLAVYARHSSEQIADAVRAVSATMPRNGKNFDA